jgi:cytidylate kinase
MSSIESIINRQLQRWELEKKLQALEAEEGHEVRQKPIVTVSRLRGSGGAIIAARLAERLHYQLLHREVIDEICSSSGYRRQVIESLDDRVRSRIELWFEGIFKGSYIDSSDYLKHLYKIIKSIAEHGGVVVVGRGANFILPREQVFSLRVTAARERRIETLMRDLKLNHEQAEKDVRETDRARAEFIHSHFKRNVDDPSAYDLVIDTTFIDIDSAVNLAEIGIWAKWKKLGIIAPNP